MFKRIVCLVLCLVLLGTAAMAEGAVTLSGDAVVDSGTIYYSGSIDSAETGVYVMTADGGTASRIHGSPMELLAADEGCLLAVSYDEPAYEYALVVLNQMGEKTVVDSTFVDYAIAAEGRFYWGIGSCALDGSDARTLITDAGNAYAYRPVAVRDGWYYYLDWDENSDTVLMEGGSDPVSARLCRLNTATNERETVSSYGTTFLGFEDNYVYFTRHSFWLYDNETGDYYMAEVNEGLFRADLDTLVTEQLVAFPDDENTYVDYQLLEDGVIYGVVSSYSAESNVCRIIRMTTDGRELPSFSLDNQSVTLHALDNGLLYASVCSIEFGDDDYIQHDLLYAVDPENSTCSLVSTAASDLFYYAEADPAIALSDGRIYMIVYDTEACAISFKSCALDGSDWRVLARGISLAEG